MYIIGEIEDKKLLETAKTSGIFWIFCITLIAILPVAAVRPAISKKYKWRGQSSPRQGEILLFGR